jgi:hypothetical protein
VCVGVARKDDEELGVGVYSESRDGVERANMAWGDRKGGGSSKHRVARAHETNQR